MSERNPKIVIIGPAYLDMAIRCQAIPLPGQKIEGSFISHTPSGAGVNRAIQAALCGCEVSLIARVGDDCFGQLIKKNLTQYNVNSDLVYAVNALVTGVKLTMVDAQGENSVCVCAGANRMMGRDEIEYAAAEQLIANCDVCLICGTLPQDTMIAAIRTAKIHKRRVVLEVCVNGHCRDLLNGPNWPMDYYDADVMIVRFVDLTCVSEFGAGGIGDLKGVASHLVAKGVSSVVISLGWRGALIADRQGGRHIPGIEQDVVDNSGTVDAFCGALAACCGAKEITDAAVQFAVAAEALARSRFGIQDALPKKEEIIVLLQRQPE